MSARHRALRLLLHVAIPLALGGFIYLAWRADDLRVFAWARTCGLGPAVAVIRDRAAHALPMVPRFVRYCASDGLWVYAVTSFMAEVWRCGERRPRRLWMAAAPVLALGWELAQLARIVPGTFDLADMLAYALGYLGACATFRGAWRARRIDQPIRSTLLAIDASADASSHRAVSNG
jgi:hypothetical protein